MKRQEIEKELKTRFGITDKNILYQYVDHVREIVKLAYYKFNGDQAEMNKAARLQIELLGKYLMP